MVNLNTHYDDLAGSYLFPEIGRRAKLFQDGHPGVKLMRLGIGDTTEPLTPTPADFLEEASRRMRTIVPYTQAEIESSKMRQILADAGLDRYTGYGKEQGNTRLRVEISNWYTQNRNVFIHPDEIFISDGAKPDSANIQTLFGLDAVVAVQDPAYPIPVDTNVIAGRAGKADANGQHAGIVYMPCTEENGFIPQPPKQKVDLIYLISPNNPTGAVFNHDQLRRFIDYARENDAVIVYDAAYFPFIKDESLPKSIYEISGAQSHAIEINSFSKWAGFTGLRLGWTVIPKKSGIESKINAMWNGRQTRFFNGASNVVQAAGLGVFTPQGQKESQGLVDHYMGNAGIIRESLTNKGLKVFGGDNAPFLWVKTPGNMDSWEFFDKVLNEAHVVCTPGGGFGPSGKNFVRFSAFGHRDDVLEAADSIEKNLKL